MVAKKYHIDLFSGIGGFTIAAQRNNFETVLACEIDKFARKTYSANFDMPIVENIFELDSLPNADLLTAGFPCQPFSIARLWQSEWYEHDKSNMIFKVLDLLKKSNVKHILFENVPRLEKLPLLNVIISELNNLGYITSYRLINSKHFGPQKRNRLFIFGSKELNIDIETFVLPSNEQVLADILELDVDDRYFLSDNMVSYAMKPDRLRWKTKVYTDTNIKSRTLVATYAKDGTEILIPTERGLRKLTERECARLMGFPEEFIIPVSKFQAYKQFGNSISVPVVDFLIRKIQIEIGQNST